MVGNYVLDPRSRTAVMWEMQALIPEAGPAIAESETTATHGQTNGYVLFIHFNLIITVNCV